MRPSLKIPALRIAVVLALLAPVGAAVARPPKVAQHPGRNGKLTENQLQMAKIAWKYFENNFQADTCLVNAVDNYPSTTMWDAGSSLGALISAFELGVVDEDTFHSRVRCTLITLGKLDLYKGELPNKAYDTRTGAMVNYANEPGEIGYSALDIGRLLIWLRILQERQPHYIPAVNAIVARWNFCNLLDKCGTLYGAVPEGAGTVYLQEGRLGYEEYAAKGFQLWGFDTKEASRLEPMELDRIHGIDIPFDSRDPRLLGAHNYVVTESYALDGIELNWDNAGDRSLDDMRHSDKTAADFAGRVYDVQEARHAATGILTARTEHQLDAAPWFVYDTVYSDGYRWNTITDDGRYLPASAAVSTKAAFSLWALWDTPYTQLLYTAMVGKFDPERGYYEGVYEHSGVEIKTFTANSNGIILETLLYKVQGKLLRFGPGALPSWASTEGDVARSSCQLPSHQRSPCGAAPSR
ncbi:MAG: DUF3131 domain-containing protein [Pseudomonadota bacterium]|nr:DUF3131 domain-containing protein [Pseudomonadota bacterium]